MRLAPAGLLVAAMTLAFVLLETGLRLAGWDTRVQSEWMLGHPSVALDSDVITMHRRLLDPAFYAPAPAPLIVAIGDSYTEGFPVGAAQSYPAVLARTLARRGVTVTVRNAGMGDTGPDQQLRLLETRLLKTLRPSVVIWQIYANDVWDNVIKATYRLRGDRLEPVSGTFHWLALRQRFFDWTPLPMGVKKESRVVRVMLRAFEPRGGPREGQDLIAASLTKLGHEIDEFERLAERYGFTPYLVLVPPQSFYLRILGAPWNHAWNVEAHERLTILLGDRPELIDGFLGSANGDAFFDSTRDPAERGHRHLNERGYARLAVRIARRLLHDGVFATGPAASRLPTGTREDEHGSNAFRRR